MGAHPSGAPLIGGSLTIGGSVSGGTANRVLYIDSLGKVAQSALFTFNGVDTFLLNGTILSGGRYNFNAEPDCGLNNSGTNEIYLETAGNSRLIVRATGHIEPGTNNSYDLGVSGNTWRDIFGGRNLSVFADGDSTSIIGRGRFDARLTDTISISHFDQSGTTGYGFQCQATGATRVNALAGQGIRLAIGDSSKWEVNSSGHFMAVTDNTNDIGGDGATRPRNIRAAGKLAVGDGTASVPTLCFDAEESTGGYHPNTGEFAIACSGSVRMRITTTGLGLNGQNPTSPQAYNITNVTTDRTLDANATTVDELADAFGTLIADLRAVGLVT